MGTMVKSGVVSWILRSPNQGTCLHADTLGEGSSLVSGEFVGMCSEKALWGSLKSKGRGFW